MVTRAKGTRSEAAINAACPYQVEATVPWDGLGRRYSEMSAWAARCGCDHGVQDDGDRLRFCFGIEAVAHAFQVAFGGELRWIAPPLARKARSA